jgi:hypothetical protein
VRVFVSYSRAQFYLAEDLALALGQHGIDAWFDVHRLQPGGDWDGAIVEAVRATDGVVLVASREALASPHVRAELDVAQKLGKPVIVALAGPVDLPDRLTDAPRIDLQRGFEDKVRWLSVALEDGSPVAPINAVPSSWGARAGVVRMVSVALLSVALLFAACAVFWSPGSEERFATLLRVTCALTGALCCWLWWAFSHRRPGAMIGLGAAFAVGALTAALAGGAQVYVLVFSPGFGSMEPIVAVVWLCLITAPFVVSVQVARSGPFYRWLATGDAPRWMRRRMLARRGHRASAKAQSSAVSVTYDVRCHELDESVERGLDRALQAAGHRRSDGASADRQILVLSNLTPIDWLNRTLAQLGRRTVVVISAPVSLAALEHFERYQWVDYRRRERRTLDRLAASIGGGSTAAGAELVPERFARRVVPLGVFVLSGLYVVNAAAGLGWGIVLLSGSDITTMYGGPRSSLLPLVVVLVGTPMFLWLALALATRRIPLRYLLALVIVNVLAIYAQTTLLYPDAPAGTRLLAPLVGPLMLLVCWTSLARWLPPRAVRSNVLTLAAVNPAWWRRPSQAVSRSRRRR